MLMHVLFAVAEINILLLATFVCLFSIVYYQVYGEKKVIHNWELRRKATWKFSCTTNG